MIFNSRCRVFFVLRLTIGSFSFNRGVLMNKWWKIGCIVTVIIIVLCIVAAAVIAIIANIGGQSKQSQQTPSDPVRALQVELITPNEDEEWPVNASVPVRAMVKSTDRVTAVELWIDGELFAIRDGLNDHTFSTATGEWFWQPATTGLHTLFVRGADSNGETNYSKIVHIQAVEASGSRKLITPVIGQTLDQIAASNGIDVNELLENNPDLEADQPLGPDQDIFIPEAPEPVKEVGDASIDPYEPPTPKSSKGGMEWLGNLPGIGNLIQNITGTPNSSLPAAPTLIKAELQSGCSAYLEFKDNAGNEDGNRIYRAVPGQTGFSKVADLPPYITKTIIHQDPKLNIKGGWTYYAAAYNGKGESKSLPITIDLTDPTCFPPEQEPATEPGGDKYRGKFTEDLIIISPEPVDMAYLYVTINDQTSRIPADSGTFFQKGSGYTFDISEYLLANIETLPDATEYRIKVQLWGWKGGIPVLIEEYEKIISDYTRLMGCLEISPGYCDSPSAVWSTNVLIPETVELQNVQLRFKMLTLKKSTGAYWRLSSATLYGEEFKTDSFENTQAPAQGGVPAQFSDTWASLYDTTNQEPGPAYDYETDTLPWTKKDFWRTHDKDSGFLVYYEAWPNYLNPDNGYYEYPVTSNRVYIYNQLGQPAPEPEIPLAPTLPDIYQIEFLEETYVLPEFPIKARYGCIQYMDNGQEQCPVPFVNPCADSMSWDCFIATGIAFTDQYIDAYDWFAARYNEVVGVVSNELIDIIPGCRGTSECEWVSVKVTELAWSFITAELGLPEKLPTSEQAGDAAIEYIIQYYVGSAYNTVVYESGLMEWLQKSGADEYIMGVVSNYLSEKANEYQDKLVGELTREFLKSITIDQAAACVDIEDAHNQGFEPFCPDPNRFWKPAPGAEFVGPSIHVKITRKALTDNTNFGTNAESVQFSDSNKYALKVTNSTVNEYRIGQVVPSWAGYSESYTKNSCSSGCKPYGSGAPICYFGYGGQIAVPCWFEIKTALQGSLYRDIQLPIPWLEIGKSVELPVYFPEKTFWVPGKQYEISEVTDPEKWKFNNGDDWNYLYFYGVQNFRANQSVNPTCRINYSAAQAINSPRRSLLHRQISHIEYWQLHG